MVFQNLITGSKGNASIVKTHNTTILIDAGITYTKLKELINLEELDAIIITHMHDDHANGLVVMMKHLNIPVYIPKGSVIKEKYQNIKFAYYNESFFIKDVYIQPFLLSHDVVTFGFLIKYLDKEIVYITDTGFIPKVYFERLKNKDIYYIESNFDVNMLIEGKYPYHLRKRVLGESGHLSNIESATFIKEVIGFNTKKIILGHLSEDNNTEEKVSDTFNSILEEGFQKVEIADPYNGSTSVELETFFDKIIKEYDRVRIYPDKKDIFKALKLTPLSDVKAVMIGQDPYYSGNRANGLSFSIKEGSQMSKSLTNIFLELKNDLDVEKESSDLSSWAKSGVLLLNRVLTVEEGKPNSHKGIGWEQYTDLIIKRINNEKKNVVFILLGKEAQTIERLIDEKKHLIIKTYHPAPPACYKGFFNSKIFSKTNKYLIDNGIDPINWN